MYRLSTLSVLAASSVIILSGCSKSTEPQTQKPNYFTSTGIAYPNWHDTGAPEGMLPHYSAMEQMNYKAKAYYFNYLPSDVQLHTILGQVPDGYTGDENVLVMDVVYDPALRGAYNYTPDLTQPEKCWAGLQRLVSQDEVKGDVHSYQIQMWINVQQAPKGAKLFIDLGKISEDVIPNGRFDYEDRNLNGLLDSGEDNGLDGTPDHLEPNYNELTNPDPAGDNYSYYPMSADYSRLNGTENNGVLLDLGKKPDTEDIDGNLDLEKQNDFYRYEIQLDSLDADNRFIVERGNRGWVNVKIPVSAYKDIIGRQVDVAPMVMRLWFIGAQSPIRLRFAELRLKLLE